MAEEFQGGVCGGSRWINPSANLFRPSPCSSAINDPGSFGWPNHEPIIDMKTSLRPVSDDSAGSTSDTSGSIVLQDVRKPSDENVSIASPLHMMGINWNQDLRLHGNIGRSEQKNYSNHMLQATSDFTLNNYGHNSSNINFFRQENQNPPFNSASSLLQTLFDTDQRSLFDNQTTIYSSSIPDYMNSFEFCPNNTPFWTNDVASDFLTSSQHQLLLPSSLNIANPNLHSLSTKKHKQEAGELNSMAPKKESSELPLKRPRIETRSPLPTFKVRKEKLGDRVTALHQLVSPFGKTDTASVLLEAIEYIKFLHDQVSVLSTPYLKNESPQLQHQQAAAAYKIKDENGQIQDLKSRGLCLVPITSTFPVAAEATTDFWTPTFGGCFR